jgi:hypothetical protein
LSHFYLTTNRQVPLGGLGSFRWDSREIFKFFNLKNATEDHRIDFTSHGVNQCPVLLAPIDTPGRPDVQPPAPPLPPTTTENPFKPWKPAIIQGETVFTARIGPAGGKKGYSAITGDLIFQFLNI